MPQIIAGEEVGTLFVPRESKLTARKRWIAVRSRSMGVIRVDREAAKALTVGRASLMPAGIRSVRGRFEMGDRVEIQNDKGKTIAVGLASYRADEIKRLQGKARTEYTDVLGYEYVKEIVDRDDMVLIE